MLPIHQPTADLAGGSDQAQAQALSQLKQQALSIYGNEYTLTDSGHPVVSHVYSFDPKTGVASLIVRIQGQWTYQFSTAQIQEIKHSLAGKDMDDASALLREQRGIALARINNSYSLIHTLPILANNITIHVQQ